MRCLISAALVLFWSLSAQAATTFSGLPDATEPLSGTEIIPMDQGVNTVKAPVSRIGQPAQTTCTSISTPFLYQQCIDTSTAPPTLRIWLGTQWAAIALYDTNGQQVTSFTNQVSSNADLAASCIAVSVNCPIGKAVYPNGVWRTGFSAAGDVPALFYNPSNAPCSLNGGNGDNGSQVKSADNNCWLAVWPSAGIDIVQFGAATAHADDTTPFQSALNAAFTKNLPLLLTIQFKFTSAVFYGGMTIVASNNNCLDRIATGPGLHEVDAIGHTFAQSVTWTPNLITNLCINGNGHAGTNFMIEAAAYNNVVNLNSYGTADTGTWGYVDSGGAATLKNANTTVKSSTAGGSHYNVFDGGNAGILNQAACGSFSGVGVAFEGGAGATFHNNANTMRGNIKVRCNRVGIAVDDGSDNRFDTVDTSASTTGYNIGCATASITGTIIVNPYAEGETTAVNDCAITSSQGGSIGTKIYDFASTSGTTTLAALTGQNTLYYGKSPISMPNLLRNPLINDAQQYGTGGVNVATATDYYPADQWGVRMVSAGAAGVTAQAVSDPGASTNNPLGAWKNALKVRVGTGSAVGAGEYLIVEQPLMGVDLTTTNFGNSTAQPLCATAMVKAIGVTLPITIDVGFQNAAKTRSFVRDVVINNSGFQQVALEMPGDTTGTWNIADYNAGGYFLVTLAAGSTFQGTAGSWQASDVRATSNISNTLLTTNGAIFEITRAKLEVCPTQFPTQFTSFGPDLELRRDQAFFSKTLAQQTAINTGGGQGLPGALCNVAITPTVGSLSVYWAFPATMHTTPTVATFNVANAGANWRDITAASDATVLVDPSSTVGVGGIQIGEQTTLLTAGHNYCIHATANAQLPL